MPSRDRRAARVQYRYVADTSRLNEHQTLAKLLTAAWNSDLQDGTVAVRPEKREWQISNHESITLTWAAGNEHEFLGELVVTEPGGLVPLLSKTTPNSSYLELRQMKVPDKHEPCQGVLYFLALRNHVLILEKGCSAKNVEKYVTWLCREHLELPEDFHVILEPKVEITQETGRMSEIKEIEFRPDPITPELPIERAAKGQASQTIRGSKALDIMKAMGFQDDDFDRIMEEHDNAGHIELYVRLQMKHRNRKLSLDKISLDNVGRNFDEDEIILSGPSGKRVGSIVRLSHSVSVLMKGSLMDPDDARRALREGYEYFVANGFIEP